MTESSDFQTLHEIVHAARATLSREVWDYVMGGAETETTLKRNRQALDALAFRPRVLRDVGEIDCGVELLGQRLRIPVLLAPIGSMQDIVADGGITPARAAAEFGTVQILSSACEPGLEKVAAAAGAAKIFQLYVRGDADWVEDTLRRAVDAGYIAFCFTVDLDRYGRRERDIARRHVTTARLTVAGEEYQARFNWADIAAIRARHDIPLILKGIATAEDAALAVEAGIDIVYVSNHGGRQLDHGRGGADVLPEIVEAVAGRARVIFDG
ncbi:MAG: alpha-hydroxy acid oxidase, partial [Alphaproteobacteria bacterium]